MRDRRALVVTTATGGGAQQNGATLRVDDVRAVLEQAGFAVTTSVKPHGDGWDLGVAVSYASAGAMRELRRRCRRTWLDAVDSWLLVDGSGLRAGHPTYALRAVRDGARLLAAPRADAVTYISDADRRSDRGTVRGRRRYVLPGSVEAPVARPSTGCRRVVLAADWAYLPNRDGLAWFTRRVLPLLTGVRVEVYGRDARAAPDLVVHGHVTNPAQLHQEGDVHVVPVRHGGGVKRKTLTPLLLGLPVVSTAAGAHGLRPHPLLDVADDPEGFAAAVMARLEAPPPGIRVHPAELFDRDDRERLLAWLRC